MLALALVSPFAALGFLFVMHGFERWLLGAPPAVLSPNAIAVAGSPNAIAVAGIAEDDLADPMTIRHGDGIAQPRLSAVAVQADLFGRRVQQNTAASDSDHRRDAA